VERGEQPGVGELYDHPVAGLDAEVEKVQRDALRRGGKLRVGVGTLVI